MRRLSDELFIGGDASRLFLNLELGCNSSCSYCYLPSEGIPLGTRPQQSSTRSPEELLDQLRSDSRFMPGRDGTVLSIGCFSECWDSKTRPKTIQLIKALLPFDNWIQFATKREINQHDLRSIVSNSSWREQAVAYVSSATIRQWKKFERGTTRPERRFRSFSACRASGVRTCLYVKPVIPDVTVHDADLYGSLMQSQGVDVVVGDLFVPGLASDAALSPISGLLHVAQHPDATLLRRTFSKFGRVFESSTQHLTQGPR